jgi:uncharacterized protein (DUF1697 family)
MKRVSSFAPRTLASGRVALIRGINVGRAKRVAMADLRALMIDLGYTNVRSLLNSGNIVFTAPSRLQGDAAARIQSAILKQLGVSARVIVITAAQLDEIAAEKSLCNIVTDPARLLVTFVPDRAALAKFKTFTDQDWTPDALVLGRLAAYVWCANGILESKLLSAINRALGDAMTTRNWSTVLKLQALMRADEGNEQAQSS